MTFMQGEFMTATKRICPFTDQPCSDCPLLFADELAGDKENSLRGCKLLEKSAEQPPC